MNCCNGTTFNFLNWCPQDQVLFGLLIMVLCLSVAFNIYCCASKHCAGKRTSKERARSRNQRRMEENPIYGNIAMQCTQSATAITDINFTNASYASSARRDQQRVNPQSQDCYANLALKSARSVDCGPSPPLSPVERDLEEKQADNAEVLSNVSELYASVHTRAKILDNTDSAEEYANHL